MSRCTSAAPALVAAALGLTSAPAQADAPSRGDAAATDAPRADGDAAADVPRAGGDAAAGAPRAGGDAPRSALRGAVVVAVDDASVEAARSLARSIYRDPALRPPIDEASAQALTGEPPAPDAPAAVKELAVVRRSAGRAESEPVARRLLASLGADAGAALVVAVTTAQGHPVARVLRVAGASYAPLELGATIQRAEEGATAAATFDWPGAAAAVRALLAGDARDEGAAARPAAPPARAAARSGPLRGDARAGVDLTSKAAQGDQGSSGRRSVWSSPWFWGPLAGVAVTGIAVLVLAQTGGDDGGTVHLRGRIAP
ncbi:hypothetical protein [Sorangium sp. So ce406]|uniref:hypothetical protein n=1 Tax=Sorangium sp. So ce406 TaxID=3133311 RepID=UPI003F5BAC8B